MTSSAKIQVIANTNNDFPYYTGKIRGLIASLRTHLRTENSGYLSCACCTEYCPKNICHLSMHAAASEAAGARITLSDCELREAVELKGRAS